MLLSTEAFSTMNDMQLKFLKKENYLHEEERAHFYFQVISIWVIWTFINC